VALSIGKYENEPLCDVVPMHACHLLLGSDMNSTNNGDETR
jgi:hypothetical protein